MKRISGLVIVGIAVLLAGGCLDVNERPVAAFTRSPASGPAPLSVFFDAAGSSDPDGTIVTYTWSFGDDSAIDSTSGVTATHVYVEPGTYSVTLAVADDAGEVSEAVRNVVVSDTDEAPPFGTEIGEQAPDFSLPDVRTGELLSLSELRGHVVLLEFWRSTCSACRSAMPGIEALRQRFADQGVVLLLVSEDASAEDARRHLDSQGYDETIAVHDSLETARDLYEVELVPRLFVLDRQGVIRHVDHPMRVRDRHVEPWL